MANRLVSGYFLVCERARLALETGNKLTTGPEMESEEFGVNYAAKGFFILLIQTPICSV